MDYKNSVLAGLVGGVAMGLIMALLGSTPMVAELVAPNSALWGWVSFLVVSAVLGVLFTMVFGSRLSRGNMNPLGGGLLYGFIWYLLGPLTLWPGLMGMGLQWSGAGISGSVNSLVGHLIFGAVLGWVYQRLSNQSVGTRATPAS